LIIVAIHQPQYLPRIGKFCR